MQLSESFAGPGPSYRPQEEAGVSQEKAWGPVWSLPEMHGSEAAPLLPMVSLPKGN